MKMQTITLPADDLEPLLREAARNAAKFGALCDYIGPKTWHSPVQSGETIAEARQRWQRKFLQAKRIVESFGVEYEPTSEAETMTVDFPWKNEKMKIITLPTIGKIRHRSGGEQDFKKPHPAYSNGIHQTACEAAADRVVRRWRET